MDNIENDRVYTSTQEMLEDGHHLMEKKQETLHRANGKTTGLVLVHERTIDDKSYKVTETINYYCENDCDGCDRCRPNEPSYIFTLSSHKIETEMDEEEVKQFEEDWTSMWDPDFTVKEIDYLPPKDEVVCVSDQ